MKKIIKTIVLTVMMGFVSLSYASSNSSILLPEIKALALDRMVTDRADKSVTVLESAVIYANGLVPSQGIVDVKVTLDINAKVGLVIQGKTINPGESISLQQNLSQTGGAIKIPAYPSNGGIIGDSKYTLEASNVSVSLCDADYQHNQFTNKCEKLITTEVQYACPDGSWVQSGDLQNCIQTVSVAKDSCPNGFISLGNGTCEQAVTNAASKYCKDGYKDSNSGCEKLAVVPQNVSCPVGYNLDSSNRCVKSTITSQTYGCTNGWTESGSRCSRTLTTSTYGDQCPSGYGSFLDDDTSKMFGANLIRPGSTCYKMSSTYCPDPKRWKTDYNGECASFVNNPMPLAENCPSDYPHVAYTFPATQQKKCAKVSPLEINSTCSNPKAIRANGAGWQCYDPTDRVVNKVETKVEYTDKWYFCNSGSISGNVCESKNYASSVKSCPVGTTLVNSNCEQTLAEEYQWACPSDFTYKGNAICEKINTFPIVSKCPTNYVQNGSQCEYLSTTVPFSLCPEGYSKIDGACERKLLSSPSCLNGVYSESCSCPVGMSLNSETKLCENIDKVSIATSCPAGYTRNGSLCELKYNVGLIYDFCPPGMTDDGVNCSKTQTVSLDKQCSSPKHLNGNSCLYTDIKIPGYTSGNKTTKISEGIFKTESSKIKLKKKEFQTIVEKLNEIPIDVDGGCKLVADKQKAQGAIGKGNVACSIEWRDLPSGIVAENNILTGVFENAGHYSLNYTLVGYSGSALQRFEIARDAIEVTVLMPEKPKFTNISTRLMNKSISGFEMINYDRKSKISFTSVMVETRPYIQLIEIADIGECLIAVGETSCNIYSNADLGGDVNEVAFDKQYQLTANSVGRGWSETETTKQDWMIHNDYRGPKVLFTQFNPQKDSPELINTELGFPVSIAGGNGAVGVVNQRPELPESEIWWKPARVSLVFKAKKGTESTNRLQVNDFEVSFDFAQGNTDDVKISNWTVVKGSDGNAYPFDMKSINPGVYAVELNVSDSYQNQTVVTYENVVLENPLPQIRVLRNGNSIEKLSSTQSINMLDDVIVVAHNGVPGETTITSVKIDGKEAISLNSDKHFKLLTSEGFDLKANNSYSIDVIAQDSKGREVSLSVPFNYLQMTFGFSRKPNTVIQKVEDVSLAVNRVRGLRCDLYGTKAAASLAARKNFHTCYIEWTSLPDGLTPDVTTYQAKLTGAVNAEGTVNIAYQAYIVNEHGRMGKIGGETVSIDTVPPIAISVRLDEKQKLSEGVYSVPVSDRSLGRYKGQSSRAGVIVEMTTDKGDSKMYAHNQLPFGEVQDFSSYADRLGDAQLWDKVQYTIDASYKLAPELKTVQKFDLIVTPHPYMQVLMDLDSAKYSSTDTILATVKLGMRNNMNGQFEYNESTMGTGWDIFLAFKNGSVYDPISEMVQVGSDGQGKLKVDANIIFNRNQPVYAVAKARSPFPEISIERVSVPRSITVVKGTGVEGKLVSRVVQGRLPANFDIRFDTASFADFMVMGNIDWEYKDETGVWSAQKEFNGRQFVSIKSEIPETLVVRATITNKVTGVVTHSDEVTLISYDVPSLRLDGANHAVSGQLVTLTALDHSDTPQNDTIVEWSVDGGKTWVVGSSKYELTVGDVTMKVQARMKYANTSLAVNSGFWSEATKYISVSKPKPLTVNVNKPSIVEVGTEIDLKLQITNPFSATGVALHTEFELPDGTIISGETSIKYVVKESDLDQSNRIAMKARAWLDGYKDATLGESNIVMNTFSYEFPLESSLSLVVNNNIKFVPSTGFATLNMPIINAPGVVFSYEWSFDPEAIEKVSVSGKGMNFKVIKAGVHKITVTLSDNRGNFAFVDGFADAIEPAPLEFKVNDVYSNKFMRAPLTLSLYPSVKSSHPYDFMKQYVWTINGEKGQPSSRAVGVFEMLPAGHYDVELDVTSNFGQQGKYTASFDVKENQAPVCEPTVREQYGTHIVDANCKDSDGTISYYRWVVNGTIFSPYGAQVRFSQQDFPTATIIIEAMDDAGAVGTGRTSF
ncbi:Ig-like domain-containing protein [Shewanella morhuae]|uniref:Protein of uncharacterized function (DUF3607) n=2 Tax=Shewanella morhuae TaxID=365591 RepID=A0A380BRN3_9GAMM|nr:Ig-like domain-containing protein [Shewanella morhuae]SUJ05380.1 Protein of uncharacterised function (DUF3607) [Shewanella morhuae]